MAGETLSLVLIIVGTVALIIMLSCLGGGERYHRHSYSCGCPGMRSYFSNPQQSGGTDLKYEEFSRGRGSGKSSSDLSYEGFSNSCPYATDSNIPVSLAGMDYGNAIKRMALESDVEASHAEWLGEFAHRTTTASKETVRDDPNNVVTPMGLAAMMRQNTQYRTRAQPLAESRTIPTDIPCDMGGSKPSLTFYGGDPE